MWLDIFITYKLGYVFALVYLILAKMYCDFVFV